MPRISGTFDHDEIAKAQRTRRPRLCDQDYAHDREIPKGELYVRLTSFLEKPPVTLKLCTYCAQQHPVAAEALAKRQAREATK